MPLVPTRGLVATDVIGPGSIGHTDESRMIGRLADMGYTHERTVAVRATGPTEVVSGVHMVASLLER